MASTMIASTRWPAADRPAGAGATSTSAAAATGRSKRSAAARDEAITPDGSSHGHGPGRAATIGPEGGALGHELNDHGDGEGPGVAERHHRDGEDVTEERERPHRR